MRFSVIIFSSCLLLVTFFYAEFQKHEINHFSIFPRVLCARHFTVVLQGLGFVLVLAKAFLFQLQNHWFHHKVKKKKISITATIRSLNEDNGKQNHIEFNFAYKFCQSTDVRATFCRIQIFFLLTLNPWHKIMCEL